MLKLSLLLVKITEFELMLLIHIISKLENWNLKSKIRLNF